MNDTATTKSYHHGNLRAELLSTAIAQLRETGVDDLSLRALARAREPEKVRVNCVL